MTPTLLVLEHCRGQQNLSRESWVLLACFFSVLGSCAPQLSGNHGSGGRGVFTERLVWNSLNSFTFLLLSFLAFPEQVLMPLNLVPAAFFSVQTVLAAHGIWGAPSPITQDYDQVCNRSSLSAFLDGPEVKNFG